MNSNTPVLKYFELENYNTKLISLEELKSFLRVSGETDDKLIKALLNTAISYAERVTGLSLVSRKMKIDAITSRTQNIDLHYRPLISVESILLDGIEVVDDNDRYSISDNFISISHDGTVEIVYLVGFDNQESIDADIRTAIMFHISTMYEGKGNGNIPKLSQEVYSRFRKYKV